MLTQIVKGFITESRGDVIIKVSKIELNMCLTNLNFRAKESWRRSG